MCLLLGCSLQVQFSYTVYQWGELTWMTLLPSVKAGEAGSPITGSRCVCVCVRARVCVCACVCMRVYPVVGFNPPFTRNKMVLFLSDLVQDFSQLVSDNCLVPHLRERTKIPSLYPIQLGTCTYMYNKHSSDENRFSSGDELS